MPRKSLTGFDANNSKLINLADGTSNTDAVTKQQLDSAVRGLSWKQAVKAASTTNGTLATAFVNGQTLDGVTLATNDRILLKNQTTASENGIRVVAASGAPARAVDADSSAELDSATVSVQQGTVNADTVWTQTANAPTVDSTSLVWAQVGAGGGGITAGNGLTGTTTFDVGAGNGISVAADSVAVDPTVVVRKYAANCAATTNPQVFTHSLGTDDVEVAVQEVSTGAYVDCDLIKASGTVSVNFGGAPTAAQYRVIIQG